MDSISKELNISSNNILPTASPTLFSVVVHNTWLKKWIKNVEVDNCVNNLDFTLQPGESVPYPWKKIFIKVVIYIFPNILTKSNQFFHITYTILSKFYFRC